MQINPEYLLEGLMLKLKLQYFGHLIQRVSSLEKTLMLGKWKWNCSVVSDSLWLHESQHTRPPYPSPTPRVHLNSCASSQWCHPAISSSVVPFSSCPQSLPESVFSNKEDPIFPLEPTDLCRFDIKILSMGFPRQEYWSGVPFPSLEGCLGCF